jgi:hypothetical protein
VISGAQNETVNDELASVLANTDILREEFERLLFWTEFYDDVLFELFDLNSSNCPEFTFVSHRWAPDSCALGLHNDLLVLLSLSKCEYM